jgi:exodeoxyribonuclease-3
MKIVSINVNGLNAYYNKGSLDYLIDKLDPDVICLQEIKCGPYRLDDILSSYPQFMYEYNCNKFKPGYAGVATLVKKDLPVDIISCESIELELQDGDIDEDKQFNMYSSGRIQLTTFNGFRLYNIYTMNSGCGKDYYRKLWDKYLLNQLLFPDVMRYPIIIAGDLNVVSGPGDYWADYNRAIDSGPGLYKFEINAFLERNHNLGLFDSYRELHPDGTNPSWFSYGDKNHIHGWRLDYFLVSRLLKNMVSDSKVFSDITGSDHRPIQLTIKD